jgi:hypothetical protein
MNGRSSKPRLNRTQMNSSTSASLGGIQISKEKIQILKGNENITGKKFIFKKENSNSKGKEIQISKGKFRFQRGNSDFKLKIQISKGKYIHF